MGKLCFDYRYNNINIQWFRSFTCNPYFTFWFYKIFKNSDPTLSYFNVNYLMGQQLIYLWVYLIGNKLYEARVKTMY